MSGVGVWRSEFGGWDLGFRVQALVFERLGFGVGILGLRVWGLGCEAGGPQDLSGIGVWRCGFRVRDFGLQISG